MNTPAQDYAATRCICETLEKREACSNPCANSRLAQTCALNIAKEIASLWANYSDDNSTQTDLSMRDYFKQAEAIDLDCVDGVLASPLKYFARAFLHDENQEDLTFCEMAESLEISIGILETERERS